MTEERFAEFLKQTLNEIDPVPPAPKDELWARIEQQRRFQKQTPRHTYKTWVAWGVGLAAMLAVGIGLGRMSVQTGVQENTPNVADAPKPTQPANGSETAYKLVVAEHLSNADALLTSFRAEPSAELDQQLADWARELLTNTRLLLDSPAANDPKVAALLADLELIIAQIVRMPSAEAATEEREIIRDGMNKTAVLPRLRATQSAVGT